MTALLTLINDIRVCIAALHRSNMNGFKKGQHLARLNARLRKLYTQLAIIGNASNPKYAVNRMMLDAELAFDVIWYAAESVVHGIATTFVAIIF